MDFKAAYRAFVTSIVKAQDYEVDPDNLPDYTDIVIENRQQFEDAVKAAVAAALLPTYCKDCGQERSRCVCASAVRDVGR